MEGNDGGVSIEVWFRDYVPSPIRYTQRQLYDRLKALQATGRIADVTVNQWGTYLYLDENEQQLSHATPTITAVTSFERWADQQGYSLDPAFQSYPSFDKTADERREGADGLATSQRVIRLPLMCIAIYEGDTLREVAPCVMDDRIYTVPDAIAALEATD